MPIERPKIERVMTDDGPHGTMTRFAVLDALDGSVLTLCKPRHRWRRCLRSGRATRVQAR
jgi:hypothetical protein